MDPFMSTQAPSSSARGQTHGDTPRTAVGATSSSPAMSSALPRTARATSPDGVHAGVSPLHGSSGRAAKEFSVSTNALTTPWGLTPSTSSLHAATTSAATMTPPGTEGGTYGYAQRTMTMWDPHETDSRAGAAGELMLMHAHTAFSSTPFLTSTGGAAELFVPASIGAGVDSVDPSSPSRTQRPAALRACEGEDAQSEVGVLGDAQTEGFTVVRASDDAYAALARSPSPVPSKRHSVVSLNSINEDEHEFLPCPRGWPTWLPGVHPVGEPSPLSFPLEEEGCARGTVAEQGSATATASTTAARAVGFADCSGGAPSSHAILGLSAYSAAMESEGAALAGCWTEKMAYPPRRLFQRFDEDLLVYTAMHRDNTQVGASSSTSTTAATAAATAAAADAASAALSSGGVAFRLHWCCETHWRAIERTERGVQYPVDGPYTDVYCVPARSPVKRARRRLSLPFARTRSPPPPQPPHRSLPASGCPDLGEDAREEVKADEQDWEIRTLPCFVKLPASVLYAVGQGPAAAAAAAPQSQSERQRRSCSAHKGKHGIFEVPACEFCGCTVGAAMNDANRCAVVQSTREGVTGGQRRRSPEWCYTRSPSARDHCGSTSAKAQVRRSTNSWRATARRSDQTSVSTARALSSSSSESAMTTTVDSDTSSDAFTFADVQLCSDSTHEEALLAALIQLQ